MKEKSTTRQLAEAIQFHNGKGLIEIHHQGMQFVAAGLCPDLESAYRYMLELVRKDYAKRFKTV